MQRLFRLWQTSAVDLRVLYTVLRSPNRPKWVLPASIALAFFALDPLNLAILPLGIVDDVVLLPLLLHALAKLAAAAAHEPVDPRSREDRVVSIQ